MRASERLQVIAIWVALWLPSIALADYRAYARGQEAAADGKWSEVEAAMQESLAANPAPKVRVKLYGQRFAPYVPQYYLGLAAYRQNDCAGALRWFGDATAASIIAQVPEFKGVADAARGDCGTRLATNKPAVDKPAVIEKPVVAPPVVTQNPPPATPSKPPVSVQPGNTPVPPVAPSAQSTPVVAAALQGALQNWLAGRYRAVIAAPTAGLQGKSLAHLHLLRAAAFFAQSEIEPANSATLRASAEQEVRNARRAVPTLAPDAGFHSPRFRSFFTSVR
ncbi:MAG: hypothetical protein KA505_00640 [Xanthomonadales bacterium]|nr:hypothetical protein [Xanthomonadales bacterium]MBP6077299.1 hypothetical protein [Xanthomonadales bacterium]MBP7623845.1 hypothetical protein [Xanthomonadales bacterium]